MAELMELPFWGGGRLTDADQRSHVLDGLLISQIHLLPQEVTKQLCGHSCEITLDTWLVFTMTVGNLTVLIGQLSGHPVCKTT